MKCHGFSPTLCGSGSGAMFCTFAISIMWSVKLAPAQKIPAGFGTGGRSLLAASGWPSVRLAALAAANDLSARDFTKRPHVADTSPFKYDWLGQKNFDGACPLGPWIVP